MTAAVYVSAAATNNKKKQPPPPGFARQVVSAVHRKWRAQAARAAAWRRLFSLLAFLALLLGVLYAQRGAAAAFKVHSTLSGALAPPDGPLASADDVYDWLARVVGSVWRDPVCGDSLCETPFEFASYGRFGCRADCGALIDLQALSSLDVDLYFDFNHPPGSLPAADLVAQASWNLCPERTAYDSGCYFAEDRRFEAAAGAAHVTLPDVPDGRWSLVVKRDMMTKVRGAVRDSRLVERGAAMVKVYVAAAAVWAEQSQELALLNLALNATRTPFLDYLPTMWAASRASAGRDAFDAQQMRNATCVCGAGAAAALEGTAGFEGEASWQAGGNCTGVGVLSRRVWYENGTSEIVTPPAVPDAAACSEAAANLTTHRAALNSTLLSWLVGQRLGNQVTTGKVANRTATIEALRASMAARQPELLAPVFTAPKGADAGGDPAAATLASLVALYVDAPSFVAGGAPAHLALFRRRLTQDPNMTFVAWGSRAEARASEIAAQRAEVDAMALHLDAVGDGGSGGGGKTVGALVRAFRGAGATSSFLPPLNSTALGAYAAAYDLASWGGGAYEFVSCDLVRRAPEYVGVCSAKPVSCAPTSDDNRPYNCTRLIDGGGGDGNGNGGAPAGTTVQGNLTSSAYREQCELPCDLELDCGALCSCGSSGCAPGEVCVCAACRALQGDAAADGEFVTIAAAVTSSGGTAALFAPVGGSGGGGGGGSSARRRLLEASNDEVIEKLSAVSAKVDALRSAQEGAASQVAALQGKVDQANALAEARASNTRVADLIVAGRADIVAGQATLESKLDALLQRQQAALDAARAASSALAAVRDLGERQLQALAGLDAAVKEQVRTISVATRQGLISLQTALSFWKVARRNRAAEAKLYRLANAPCVQDAVVPHAFALDNGELPRNATARDRSVGLNNRVIGGMLLHTWRAVRGECPATRFSAVSGACRLRGSGAGGRGGGGSAFDTSPYGVDPAFKPGAASFQPDLAAADDAPALRLYDCGGLPEGAAAYGLRDPATGLVSNPRPYCAQLFNPR